MGDEGATGTEEPEPEIGAAPRPPRYPFNLEEQPGRLDPEKAAVAERLEDALEERKRIVEPHILRPLAALAEIEALCRSSAQGHAPPNPEDRRSAAADLQLAFTSIGKQTRRLLQPAHYELINDLVPRLPTLLKDPGGRLHVVGVVGELRHRLITDDGLVAAWRDLRKLACAGAADEDVRLAGSRLIEIAEARGIEWRWTRSSVVQYLRRGLFDEVEDELRRPTERTAKAAWFIFGYADVPDGHLRIGQVQFFSSRLWPDAVRDRQFVERFPDAEYPDEITDDVIEQWLKVDPDFVPPKFVWARVELQGPRAKGANNPWAHSVPPLQWARAYVQALVQAATFRQGGSSWRLLEGEALYHDHGGWSGSWPFHDPDLFNPERDARDPLHEGTGEALEELAPDFALRLAEGAPDAQAAAREVSWHLAVERQDDPAQRLALFVRGFELSLPIIGEERWHGAVSRYFRDFWALHRLADDLVPLASASERMLRWTGQNELLKQLPQFIEHNGPAFTVHLEALVEAAPLLLANAPQGRREEKRALRRVVKWAGDRKVAFAEVDARRQQFHILLARATRQRNAVVHGVETVSAVVATAEPFIAWLAATVVATAVAEASTGTPVHEALERGRMIAARRLWRLQHDAGPVGSILFG
jgi:hypothetical protein